MFLTLESQTNVFLLSCLGGFAVGLGYDVLQCLRAAIGRGRVLTAVFDGLFWLWFASSFFLFCVTVAKGEMRGYLFIGLGLGFLLYPPDPLPAGTGGCWGCCLAACAGC